MADPNRKKYNIVLYSEHSDNPLHGVPLHSQLPRFQWKMNRQILPASKIRMTQFNGHLIASQNDLTLSLIHI